MYSYTSVVWIFRNFQREMYMYTKISRTTMTSHLCRQKKGSGINHEHLRTTFSVLENICAAWLYHSVHTGNRAQQKWVALVQWDGAVTKRLTDLRHILLHVKEG